MKFLRRLMGLLGVKLAGFACLDEFGGIAERRGPIESAAEGFAGESARRGMVAAFASVDVGEELVSFCGDAFQGNPVWSLAVQIVVLDAVV